MPHNSIKLNIGKWFIQVNCQDERLLQRLTSHYHEFIREGCSDMEITLMPQQGEYVGDMDVHCEGAKALFDALAYRGEIDSEKLSGSLTYSFKDAFIGADYFLRIATSLLVFRKGGLLFHAAGIKRNNHAYVFVGHSGAGKTTIARNSPLDSVLNDDLLVLTPDHQDWMVYATPFYNPTQVRPKAGSALLKAVFFLIQAKTVCLEKPTPAQALAKMVANVPVLTMSTAYTGTIVQRCSEILKRCDAFYLHFLPDSSFWKAIDENYQNCLD